MVTFDETAIKGTCNLHEEILKRDICMEECSELVQAISKVTRDKFYTPDDEKDSIKIQSHRNNEIEEIGDVILSIKMLMYYDHISEEDIQAWIDSKQTRQMLRDYYTIKGLDREDMMDYYGYCKEHLK